MARLQTDKAVDFANQVVGLVQQLHAVRAAAAGLLAVNTDTPVGNLWNALKTTALSADGSLGDPDVEVAAAHPIDPRVYPGIGRAVSQNELNNALGILVDFGAFCDGEQVAANPARPAQVNAVAI